MTSPPFLPYGRQSIDQEDIDAVLATLNSDWLTTGPAIPRFEDALKQFTGSRHAVAVSSGTAALHAAIFAAGIGPGDEVIVPPLTFAATANAVIYQGATPVFADVDNQGLLLDPLQVLSRITERTRAVIAVDYAGQPCDYKALRAVCERHNLILIADACHSLGGSFRGRAVGQLADLTALSFHPVKPITSAEGGMVLTDNPDYDGRMRLFRNHGIDSDHRQRQEAGSWQYSMIELGYNYRLNDLQAALGTSQMRHLQTWISRRRELAGLYTEQLAPLPQVCCLHQFDDRLSGWHLFVIRIAQEHRDALFRFLRQRNIGVNVHYDLVYHHPYYQTQYPRLSGSCPVAETACREILSLPLFPAMAEADVKRVVSAITDYFSAR